MKKVFVSAVLLIALALLMSASADSCSSEPSARQVTEVAQKTTAETALVSVPIPTVSYFQERRTIAKWTERWDKPAIATYVYLVSFGTIIGYYVADGKPASTQSYLFAEEQIVDDPYGSYDAGGQVVSAPDIDGTNGTNNPGIRFFTAEGTAVEWAGSGASYIYSDAPLPLNVPRLNRAKE